MFTFTTAISWLTGKVQAYLAIAGAAIAALLYAFLRGRASGQQSATTKQAQRTERLREKFSQIDAAKPDFDSAIGSLRKRGGQQK